MPTIHRQSIILSALLLAVAAPALAKEGLQATLDAPIGRDTPAGTELLVGMTVTVPDGSIMHAVEGSPIYLRLIAADRTSTWELGRQDDGVPGHYTMRIAVPAGGISMVEVGMHGNDDLPITVMGEPLVAGGITPLTAQAAPAAAPAITPFPRVTAAAAVPGPATSDVAAETPSTAWLVTGAGAVLAAALGLLVLATIRRTRARNAVAGARRASGA